MRDKDLKPAHDLSERDGTITLPFLHSLTILNEDDEVLFFARVVDFRLSCVSTRHCLLTDLKVGVGDGRWDNKGRLE